ncbi:MAG: TonB C-terminal domain-containing protein [Gallionella sp.]|jgi:colicin import membrane protein|nr:TonB C-terminal domain-containing protein [Gallionella sp.]
MNTAVYQDAYRLPACLLALLVHGAFLALLYFGFSWQTEPPVVMSVELWQSMPETEVAPPVAQVKEPTPVEPEVEIKPEIVVPDKKPERKPEKKPEIKPPEKKPEIKPVAKPEVKKPADVKKTAPQPSAAEMKAAQDKIDQAASTGRVVDEFVGKIQGKIRSKLVEPPDVSKDARAEFLVTVLPGGRVLPPRLLKSSGNPAYDNAVERAILKSEPLPLPADAALFNRFRELKLGFQPDNK